MEACIFIPTSNRIPALQECLESLTRQTRQEFRVLLVGIRKDEAVERLLQDFASLKIEYFIQNKKGIIGAANEALEKTREEIFIRIDDDVVLDSSWFEQVMKTFAATARLGGVTGPTILSEKGIISRDLTAFLDRFSKSKNPLLKLLSSLYKDYIYEGEIMLVSRFLKSGAFTLGSNFPECLNLAHQLEVDYLEACNFSARTPLLKKIGGFDDTFQKGLGDYHEADAAFKIKKLGYKLMFNPLCSLKHNVEQGSVGKARPETFYRIQNFFIFYGRHIGFMSWDNFFRFWTNVLLQNGYYFFRFLTTGSINQLGCLPGTIVGAVRYMFIKKER